VHNKCHESVSDRYLKKQFDDTDKESSLPITQTHRNRASGARKCQLWTKGNRNVHELWKLTGIPKSTLYRYVQQLAETGSLARKPGQGRPKRLAMAQKGATSAEIAAKLNEAHPDLNIAPRTVRENLFNLGYRVCVPLPVPLLSVAQKVRCVEWEKEHLRHSWNKTVFSDKTTIQLFRNTILARYQLGEERPSVELSSIHSKFMSGGILCSRHNWLSHVH